MSKALTSTEKSKIFRKKNNDLGRTELRGIWLTDKEKVIIKEIIKKEIEKTRDV